MVRYPKATIESLCNQATLQRFRDADSAVNELINLWTKTLGVDIQETIRDSTGQYFILDLSSIGISGLEVVILLVSRAPHNSKEKITYSIMVEEYSRIAAASAIWLWLLLDYDCEEDLAPSVEGMEVAHLGLEDIREQCSAKVPRVLFLEAIRRSISVERLCPFNTSRAARGETFVGRRKQLTSLTQNLSKDFLITGARLVGKTSLLRRACDILRSRAATRNQTYYFDCSTWGDFNDCCHQVAHMVAPKRERRVDLASRNFDYLLRAESAQGRFPLLLFLDEFDRVVDIDCRAGWPFLRCLQAAKVENYVRLVFAGYRSVQKITQSMDSPFFDAMTPELLEPLSNTEAKELFTKLFEIVKFDFERPAVPDYVARASGGMPHIVQFYGESLFEGALKNKSSRITMHDVRDLEKSWKFHQYILGQFRTNTNMNERICTYVFAISEDDGPWSAGKFRARCARQGHLMSTDTIEDALNNLVLANVLRFYGERYTFLYPTMKSLLVRAYPKASDIISV